MRYTHTGNGTRWMCMAVLAVLLPMVVIADSVTATNRPPVQTFYMPLPEESVLEALQTIHGGAGWVVPSEPVVSYISIAVFVDGTVLYYDQWENGYERDIANPNHIWSATNPTGTQIWGDGDPSNGYPPNYVNDKLYAGDVIVLNSNVKINGRNIAREVYYDGADKIGVTKPVAISRATWASASDTLFAGANEVYDTTYFGQDFICPVGVDTANQQEIFEYTGLSVMAGPDGAVVAIDMDADGEVDQQATLTQGQSILVNGGVKQGATVRTETGSVQVELLTGDLYDGFESRFIKLLPTRLWSSAYTLPVSTPTVTKSGSSWMTSGTKVWLYNPNDTDITILFYTTAITQARTGSVTVPAKSATDLIAASGNGAKYTGRNDSGVYFWTEDKQPFYALATVDATGTTKSTLRQLGGSNRTWDWGFALVPDNALSSQVFVGLGLGRDPTSSVNQQENGAPVWIVSDKDTVVYVDYDGRTDTGCVTDANGNKCDQVIELGKMKIAKIYNASGNQTGIQIYTLNGAKLAAAWGSDPETASSGAPGLDMGTCVPPMPEYFMQKSSKLLEDNDHDGYITPGDVLQYTIEILNVGRQPIVDLILKDVPPVDVTYVADSLTFSSTLSGYPNSQKRAIASGVSFPLMGDGLNLDNEEYSENNGALPVNGVWTYQYQATVNESVSNDTLKNLAIVVGPGATITNVVSDPLRARVGSRVWFDANNNGFCDDGEAGFEGVTVSLVDANGVVVRDDRDNPCTVTTDADGAYLFKGVRPGSYKVVFTPPAVYGFTTKVDGGSTANPDGASDILTVRGGAYYLEMNTGLIAKTDAVSVAIIKTAGDAADGEIYEVSNRANVVYSYQVRNTGLSSLKDLTITDDKLGDIGMIAGPLAPGGVATLTKTAEIGLTTVNIGSVIATPCAPDGSSLLGFAGTVSASDRAEVNVVNALPCEIGDRVWLDLNGDGLQNADELGVYGVTVLLKDEDGAEVASVKTDAYGGYYFKDIVPGSYQLQFIADGWTFTTPNVGSDDANDSDANAAGETELFTLVSGEKNRSIDAGVMKGVPPGICDLIAVAGKFNAVIVGDFTAGSGDTEGNLLIGGNASLAAGYSVGNIGPGYGRTRAPASLDTDALVVVGNLHEATAPDINGNIVYGGTYGRGADNVTTRLNSSYALRFVTPVTLDESFNVPEDGSGKLLASIAADLTKFSTIVGALEETEGVTKTVDDVSNPKWIFWEGTNSYRNVFTVTVDDFSMQSAGIYLNVPAGSKVLVNVVGDGTVAVTNSSFTLSAGVLPSQVLFNFTAATAIETSGFEFPGSVLAPQASGLFAGASIDGFAFFGGDVVTTNKGFEFHDFEFQAFDCSQSVVVTNRPALTVTISVNDSVPGSIVRATTDTALTVRQTVKNTGRTSLKNVTLTDVDHAMFDIDLLAPGESKTFTVTSVLTADRKIVASATAQPCRADGSAVEGYTTDIAASGSATLKVVTAEELADRAKAEAAAKGYVPRPDFEVVAMNFVGGAPTLTGEVFTVTATVRNVGEVAAAPGTIALFTDQADVVSREASPSATTRDIHILPVGQSREYFFTGLIAPLVGGPHHVRAVTDFEGQTAELSEGNNQLPLFYFLSNISMGITIEGQKLSIRWNSYEGQTYKILAGREIGVYDDYAIRDVDGNQIYPEITATPPFNTVTLDLTVETNRFFKVRVNNGDADDMR